YRYLSHDLYGGLSQRGVRAPCVHEKVQARSRNSESRARSHQEPLLTRNEAVLGPAGGADSENRGISCRTRIPLGSNYKTEQKEMTTESEKIDYTSSSGNVFADLGFDEPDVERVKAHLAFTIARAIEERGLTQAEAAKLLGLRQPNVSLL